MTELLASALAAEFRRKAKAKREAAEATFATVENFPGVIVRSPEAVMALLTAETLDAIADDLESIET
jgi:hypothetical protein